MTQVEAADRHPPSKLLASTRVKLRLAIASSVETVLIAVGACRWRRPLAAVLRCWRWERRELLGAAPPPLSDQLMSSSVAIRSPSQNTRTDPLEDATIATTPIRLEMDAAAMCLLPNPSGTSMSAAGTSR